MEDQFIPAKKTHLRSAAKGYIAAMIVMFFICLISCIAVVNVSTILR